MKLQPVKRPAFGFTLIELLVTIGILVALMALALPMIRNARLNARAAATNKLMGSIRTALEAYFADFNVYPDSSSSNSYTGNVTLGGSTTSTAKLTNGYNRLAQALVGFLDAEDDLAGPDRNDSASNFDPPYGFRMSEKGKLYNAYLLPNNLNYFVESDSTAPYSTSPSGNAKYISNKTTYVNQYFTDGLGNTLGSRGGVQWPMPILYYRPTNAANPTQIFGTQTTGVFNAADNSTLPASISSSVAAPQLDPSNASCHESFYRQMGSTGSPASNVKSVRDVIRSRSSYLLISAGLDGRFFVASSQGSSAACDEIFGE